MLSLHHSFVPDSEINPFLKTTIMKLKSLKKLSLKFSYMGLIFTTACMAQMSESVMDSNAGLNGGFEVFQKQLPVNWLVYTQKTVKEGKFTISSDTNVYFEGKKSLHFNVENCSNKGGRFSPGIAQEIPVNVGESYEISARIKSNASAFVIKSSAVNAFNHSAETILQKNEAKEEWTLYKATLKIPEKMERLRVELTVLSGGELWVDGIQINKLP